MMIEFDRNQMDADANATESLGPRLEALSQRIAGIVSWFESQPNDSVVLSGLVDSLRLSGRRLDRRDGYGEAGRTDQAAAQGDAAVCGQRALIAAGEE